MLDVPVAHYCLVIKHWSNLEFISMSLDKTCGNAHTEFLLKMPAFGSDCVTAGLTAKTSRGKGREVQM